MHYFHHLCVYIWQGSKFFDGPGITPEAILKVGGVVVVSCGSSVFHVFDADSAKELRRLDVSAITRQLGKDGRCARN